MEHILTQRPSWKDVLAQEKLLQLPVAHDALSARLIEEAGFKAYQIGGFALVASLHAVPDVDLEQFGEKSSAARRIISASSLPVMVDCDDGYGDAKNVTRTVREYERMGASAIFFEDQTAPAKCGHMKGKKVVPVEFMEGKLRAAVAARSRPDFFILARTDAIQPEGLDAALARGERYLKAGADGVYFEGPTSREQLEKIGKAFRGVPLATSVLEDGGVTPWQSPEEFAEMGYSMILYPVTLLFQITHTMQRALRDLKAARPMQGDAAVDMDAFERIVNLPYWDGLRKEFTPD